jgi:hypothetical protein
MSEPVAHDAPQPGGKASLKNGAEKCPLSGTVTAVLRTADSKPIDVPLNVKLRSDEGTYTETADKGTAVFQEVKPGTYKARVDVPGDVDFIQVGADKSVTAEKQQVKLVEIAVRKKPWIGWRVLDLDTNKTLGTAKFKVTVPEVATPVEVRPAGEQDIAKVEKLKGETVELNEVETTAVLVFDSLESA